MTPADWIVEAAAKATGVTVRELRGFDRHRPLVERRRFAAVKLRLEGYSYPAIGRALGGRDHSTIMSLLGATGRQRQT
jgi:chromosomal replication initiation ATPase DnaA